MMPDTDLQIALEHRSSEIYQGVHDEERGEEAKGSRLQEVFLAFT